MSVGGAREWVEFSLQSLETDDFERIGMEFEESFAVLHGQVGLAATKLVSIRSLVDFAVEWMDRNRV
jgi:aminoglycoside 3-N-acetyltransferase